MRQLLLPCVVGLVLLRSFAFISYTSFIGDIAVVAGLVTTIVYGSANRTSDKDLFDFEVVEWSGVPSFIGPASFLFALHFLMIPMSHSLQNGHSFRKLTACTYTGVTIVNAVFGATCFYLFGEDVKSNVVQNMAGSGTAETCVMVVKGLLCVDLLSTIPPVFASARVIVEQSLLSSLPDAWVHKHDTFTRNLVRMMMVGLVVGIACGVPDFGDIVSLTGGVFMTFTGFVLPPLIYNRVRDIEACANMSSAEQLFSGHQTDNITTQARYTPISRSTIETESVASPLGMLVRCFHWGIALFGVALMVLSSYYTLHAMTHK